MAEMYNNTCSSPPAPPRPPLDPDEISLFLHHFLYSSASSSSRIFDKGNQMSASSAVLPPPALFSSSLQTTSTSGFRHVQALPEDLQRPCGSVLFSDSDCRIREGTSAAESSAAIDSSTLILSSSGVSLPAEMKETGNTTSVGAGDCDAVTASVKRIRLPADNDLDDYDWESEEGPEAPEGPSKLVPPRTSSSSKRSRAAEVHNLSEKRRRSRINEKMKALQNLIPNSNKTDKASMLDEAIEYLKQLQLQVQMLSMRNGLTLHPMYLPGVLQSVQLPQMQMGFGEGERSPHVPLGTGSLPANQEGLTQTAFCLSNQCAPAQKPVVLSSTTNFTNSETSFRMELPIEPHHGLFQPSTTSEEFYGEGLLPQQQLDISQYARNPSENNMNSLTTVTLPFDAKASVVEDINRIEGCALNRERPQELLPKDIDGNRILIQHLHGCDLNKN